MLRKQISLPAELKQLLDEESARTGKSMAALIREAVIAAHRPDRSVQDDLRAIDEAFGAWAGRDVDGAEYVRQLRSGKRLAHR